MRKLYSVRAHTHTELYSIRLNSNNSSNIYDKAVCNGEKFDNNTA